MQTKWLVIFTVFLFALATGYLFWQNARELDQLADKNWWTLAFEDSRNEESLDIVVTNYTEDERFHYEVLAGGRTVAEQEFTVLPGERKVTLLPIKKEGGQRMTVRVTHGEEVQNIYRQR